MDFLAASTRGDWLVQRKSSNIAVIGVASIRNSQTEGFLPTESGFLTSTFLLKLKFPQTFFLNFGLQHKGEVRKWCSTSRSLEMLWWIQVYGFCNITSRYQSKNITFIIQKILISSVRIVVHIPSEQMSLENIISCVWSTIFWKFC